MRSRVIGLVACACLLQAHVATAQGLAGALIGSVRDAQGEVVSGAIVRLSSPALMGGPVTLTTNETGQLRFPLLQSFHDERWVNPLHHRSAPRDDRGAAEPGAVILTANLKRAAESPGKPFRATGRCGSLMRSVQGSTAARRPLRPLRPFQTGG